MKGKFSEEDNFQMRYLFILEYAYLSKEILWKFFEKE